MFKRLRNTNSINNAEYRSFSVMHSFLRRIGLHRVMAIWVGLSVGLLVIMIFAISIQEKTLLQQDERAMGIMAEGITRAMHTLMISGDAALAQDYASMLKEVPGILQLQILRVNGDEAFQDNQTIAEVNRRLRQERFHPRNQEKKLSVLAPQEPILQEALRQKRSIPRHEEKNGLHLLTLIAPILNDAVCYPCHGNDHKVQGLLRLTTSHEQVHKAILSARMAVLPVLVVAMGMILAILFLWRYRKSLSSAIELEHQQTLNDLQALLLQDNPLRERLEAFLHRLVQTSFMDQVKYAAIFIPDPKTQTSVLAASLPPEGEIVALCQQQTAANCRCRAILEGHDIIAVEPSMGCRCSPHQALYLDVSEAMLGIWMADESYSLIPEVNQLLDDATRILAEMIARTRSMEEIAKLRRAIDQSPVSVIITDTKGSIEYVNRKFTEISNYTVQEAVGQNPRILKSGLTPPEVYADLWNTLLAGQEWRGELSNRKKDGILYWESASISPMRNAEGIITHYIGVKEDITQHKAEMAARQELERQFRQAQKMEAIGLLTGGIAHDFNNILVGVKGYAELAISRFAVDESTKLHQYLENILTAANRARDLIAQMLAFGRGHEGESKVVCVDSMVKEVIKMMRAAFPSTISITVENRLAKSSGLAHIQIDPVQFHQVLLNLLVNARDAIHNQGRIDLMLDYEKVGENIICNSCHTPFSSEGMIIIAVRDYGEGIRPEIMENIFLPFFTTKEVGKGSGMGLSVVHGVTHAHGGHLHIASRMDQGTEIRLYFPGIEESATSEIEAKAFPMASGILTGKVMVVDDEEGVSGFLREFFEEMGLSVVTFSNSPIALEFFRADPQRVDVVVTDYTMPDMNGLEMARSMLSLRPQLPVILCTGYSAEIDEHSAPGQGIHTFLKKPIDIEQMTEALRSILATN